MGNATILGSSFNTSLGPGASATLVTGIGTCGWQSTQWEATGGAAESGTQVKHRAAGVLSKFGIYIITNTRSTAGTAGLRINGTNGNTAASITATTTGWFRDTTNSDTIADGDLVNARQTTGSGTGSTIPRTLWCKFVATTGTIQYFSWKANDENVTQSAASTSAYAAVSGSNLNTSPETTEANVVHKLRVAGTASRLQIYVNTNGRATNSTVNIRKNSGAANGTATITASTTGIFEDTTNSDSYSAGDTISFQYVTGTGAGNLTLSMIACKYASSSTDFELMAHSHTTGASSFSTSNPSYAPLIGSCETVTQTEADVQMKVMLSLKIDKLRIDQRANNSGTSVTVTVRKNTADTAVTLSITNNTTGMFEDTSNSFTVADGDVINVKFTNPNSATFSQRQIAVRADTSVTTDTGTPGTQRAIGLPGQ